MFSLVIREAWEELQKKQTKESKEFMKPVITPSGEDYLETILVLHKKNGYGALRRCCPAHGSVKNRVFVWRSTP